LSLTTYQRSHYINFHHIFPRSVLLKAGYDSIEANEIANMAFISGRLNRSLGDRMPDEYFPGIVDGRGQQVLASQQIPLHPDLWKLENYRLFLETRRAALAQTLNRFVEEISSSTEPMVDVSELIAAGESSLVEFKATARFNYQTRGREKDIEQVIAKTIAGFMNSGGGTLLIDVSDAGIPQGIRADLETLQRPDRDHYSQFLVQLVNTTIGREWGPYVAISFHQVEGKDICMVRVAASPRPAYVREGEERRFYVRMNNTTQLLTTDAAVQYIQQHWR